MIKDTPTSLPLLIPMPNAKLGRGLGLVGPQGPSGLGLPASILLYSRHSQHNGCDGQELPRRCELDPVIHLLPVG